MRTHDTLNRRYRLVRPSPDVQFEFIRQPKGRKVTLQDRDYLWLEKINQHGPLSSSTLRAFSRILRKSDKRATERLGDLFHEDQTPHGGPYLERPSQQRSHCNPFLDDLIYDLAPAAQAALTERGIPLYPRGGWWVHQFMNAYITSSIDLATRRDPGLRFIPQHEITGNRAVVVEYTDPETRQPASAKLIPDALFGIQYGDKRRYFVLETDRKTERINPSVAFTRKSVRRFILQYREFIGRGLYKAAYGIDAGMILLVVTTNPVHQRNMMQLAKELSGAGTGNNFMCFACLPVFDIPFFKPPPPNYGLFETPYERAGRDPFPINLP